MRPALLVSAPLWFWIEELLLLEPLLNMLLGLRLRPPLFVRLRSGFWVPLKLPCALLDRSLAGGVVLVRWLLWPLLPYEGV